MKMKDLVADYDRTVTERRNFGRTEADLIAQLINDRDDLQESLRVMEKRLHEEREAAKNRIKDLEKDYDFAVDRAAERKGQLKMIWQKLDFIIDDQPYQNRTKKETQEMIFKVMDEIRDYLKEE